MKLSNYFDLLNWLEGVNLDKKIQARSDVLVRLDLWRTTKLQWQKRQMSTQFSTAVKAEEGDALFL